MDIKIQNLKKIYNGNTVLDIDNLGVAKGELIGLVGNNGAGKTTLLRLILDLIQADDGFVESNGQKVNESETWKEYTGSYIDGRFLIDFLTPEEYFDFIADVYHIDDETLQERLAQFDVLWFSRPLGRRCSPFGDDFSFGHYAGPVFRQNPCERCVLRLGLDSFHRSCLWSFLAQPR